MTSFRLYGLKNTPVITTMQWCYSHLTFDVIIFEPVFWLVMPMVYAEWWFDRVKGEQLLYQARFCINDRHDQSENSPGPMGIASLLSCLPFCQRKAILLFFSQTLTSKKYFSTYARAQNITSSILNIVIFTPAANSQLSHSSQLILWEMFLAKYRSELHTQIEISEKKFDLNWGKCTCY